MTSRGKDDFVSFGLVAMILLCVYAFSWILLSSINRDYCETFQLEYAVTDWSFNGTCIVSGVEIPAELIGRE